MQSKRILSLFCCLIIGLAALLGGCEKLKTAKPIIPLKEYEKLLVGNINADYVGNTNCLAACHAHDQIRKDFEASTMGAQLSTKAGMPVVDCESCHGPGSLAIEGITPEKVEADRLQNIKTECNHDTLINLNTLPAGAKSLICLKCHTANATFNIHNWNAGEHALNDVSCSDCHPVHIGIDLITAPRDVKTMCFKCHQEIKAEFSLPSRHPVLENKMFCNDCHEAHGSSSEENLLRRSTIFETCTRCHMEKGGPFIFEHADVNDNCMNCHSNHGAVNNNLLKVRDPFLCLQCHMGHSINQWTGGPSTRDQKRAYYTRCTDCHSEVHGSDTPSVSGKGGLTQ